MRPRPLTIPLVPLAALATYLAGLGLSDRWSDHTGSAPELVVVLAVAGAVQLAWILPASRRSHGLIVAVAWCVGTGFCWDGLIYAGFKANAGTYAAVLDGLVLALALGHAGEVSWADRLAHWRRSRERIMTELRIGEGLLPWFKSAITRMANGQADRPLCGSFARIVAELADTEASMQRTIANLALPEAVRDTLQSAAHTIIVDAETSAAKMAIDLERRALDQAAACRDAILALDDVPDAHRERLARECESLMLDLAHNVSATSGTAR